jgi:transcriptional regulator with XRE-family HTH domain
MSSIMEQIPTVESHTDVDARIAARVRSLRSERALSLDALASRSGVSRSMISLIERAESSPTAAVLERIATGFGLPLAALFEVPHISSAPLSRRADRTTWCDPESGYVRRNISPAGGASPLQLVEVLMPAGARVAYENGPGNVGIHQQIWVQQGRVDVTVGHKTYHLTEDDCLAMQLNVPTAFRNPTRKMARYIVAIATEHSSASRR